MSNFMKTRIAVFFGGRSPEHDVSVVTGLQVLNAVDQQRFSAFPVYVSTRGDWLVGDALREQRNYLPRGPILDQLESVTLDLCPNLESRGRLLPRQPKGFFSKPRVIEFDVALLAFHGPYGEDGPIQGLFEIASVPYTGMRLLASSLAMDKSATKRFLKGTGISLLPDVILNRPSSGLIPKLEDIEESIGDAFSFPLIVKPVHLGSSIAVVKADNMGDVQAALPTIFRFDDQALVEPFVDNLVEFNVSVRKVNGIIRTSAIEKPKRTAELLDFVSKYMSGGDNKTGGKNPGELKPGLIGLTREIGPNLNEEFESTLCRWAMTCFSLLGATGAPRVDFLSNSESGELWLNEVNPCPGSFGFFLWEAANEPILFPDLVSFLIDEAIAYHGARNLPEDPTYPSSRLFERL
jgi:D-alanine-D-alanine ligase